MPARSRDETLALWALALAAAYILYDTWRNSTAVGSEGEFDSTAPSEAQGLLSTVLPMQLSPAGQAFIKKQEGWTATAKRDAGGQEIGWGHTIQSGENIKQPITQETGQQLFDGDAATAENAVNGAVTVQLNQNQFDALTDLAFDIGAGAFSSSTLVKKLNAGDYAGASQQFAVWNKSQGATNAALTGRRGAEAGLFNS